MRILKLVVWDLDETILEGILEEGDETVDPTAQRMLTELDERGILQAMATQNPSNVIPPAIEKFGWNGLFIQVEADLGPKVKKVKKIIDALGVNPLDTAFIDNLPFERDSIAAQIPGITSWSVEELAAYVDAHEADVTAEGRQRPDMYRAQMNREKDEETAVDYEDFLRQCNIQITIRLYHPNDLDRVEELLTRTHRMNLGILPVEEAIDRLTHSEEAPVIIAEMKDNYGDMGRCGVVHMEANSNGEALIESLAISCRTRARGLSLAMLVGLLRHPLVNFDGYRCRYISNGSNRPLRMLLMGAGFKPIKDTDELILTAEKLEAIELPDWVQINTF